MTNDILKYILIAVAAYFLGSFSTGIMVAKKAGHDIRSEGSKNTGASNALRILGVRGGALVFIGDFIKAALAVGLGWLLMSINGAMLGGLCVVLGHNWPIFFGFKGGKGIACSTAVLLFTFPWQAGIAIVLCLAVIYFTRYISLGSLTMLFVFAVLLLFTASFFPAAVWALVLLILGVYRHRSNLVRLKNGTENKIGQKVK
ncbi:MAG: glycerol-3-phosphate 1-O-acyltransferase PlsY [Clostridiales bacterium]|nr:glycerol-3-phosphate 1-O-acyltransferase PlsY [Clostridiales bacterium]